MSELKKLGVDILKVLNYDGRPRRQARDRAVQRLPIDITSSRTYDTSFVQDTQPRRKAPAASAAPAAETAGEPEAGSVGADPRAPKVAKARSPKVARKRSRAAQKEGQQRKRGRPFLPWQVRVQKVVQRLAESTDGTWFANPPQSYFSPKVAAQYADVVARPMDLRTIQERLSGGPGAPYEDVMGVVRDFRLMICNAKAFNGVDSKCYASGLALEVAFRKELRSIRDGALAKENGAVFAAFEPVAAYLETGALGGAAGTASAAAPAMRRGLEVRKFFPGHGSFNGHVAEVADDGVLVAYEDGDEEFLSRAAAADAHEVHRLWRAQQPTPAAVQAPAAAPAQRARSPGGSAEAQQRPRVRARGEGSVEGAGVVDIGVIHCREELSAEEVAGDLEEAKRRRLMLSEAPGSGKSDALFAGGAELVHSGAFSAELRERLSAVATTNCVNWADDDVPGARRKPMYDAAVCGLVRSRDALVALVPASVALDGYAAVAGKLRRRRDAGRGFVLYGESGTAERVTYFLLFSEVCPSEAALLLRCADVPAEDARRRVAAARAVVVAVHEPPGGWKMVRRRPHKDGSRPFSLEGG